MNVRAVPVPPAAGVAIVHLTPPQAPDAPDEPPSSAADAESAEVAEHVRDALSARGVEADIVALDVDQVDVRLPYGMVFNLVEGTTADPMAEARFARSVAAQGIACTGSPARALADALGKERARAALVQARVPVPRGMVMWDGAELPGFAGPWFVKPARADGSYGIDEGSLVHTADALAARVELLVRATGGPCLVEAFLPGPELNVACLPTPHGGTTTSVTAIDFSPCGPDVMPIVTWDAKWTPDSAAYLCRSVPAEQLASTSTIDAARVAAVRAFRALGLRGYGRVDLRVDATGRPRVIDVNPNCDLHPDAGFATAARLAGVSYDELIVRIALHALRQHRHARSPHPTARPRTARRAASRNLRVSR